MEHIPALIIAFENPFYAKFRSHRPEDFKDHAVRSVFHLLGKDVLEDPRYIEFMNGFSPNTHVRAAMPFFPLQQLFTLIISM